MDRDLHNRLQWLEDELFEEENPAADPQDFDLDDLLSEFLEEEESVSPTPAQNRAADFDRMAFGDEDFDESTAVLVTRKKTGEKPAPKAKQKKKSNKGLVILAVLEIIAIIVVLLRWALWFL